MDGTSAKPHPRTREPARSRVVHVDDYATVRDVARSMDFVPIDFARYLRSLQEASGHDLAALIQLAQNIPFFLDGPRHLQLRNLSASLLSRTRIRGWEDYLEHLADRYLDRLATLAAPDLVRDYTDPLLQVSLGAVLGVHNADSEEVSTWAQETRCLLEPLLPLRRLLRLQSSIEAMTQHIVSSPILDIPGTPRAVLDELMDHLSEDLTRNDAVALVIVLFIAGQTSSQTLGNILADVLLQPPAKKALAAEHQWVTSNIDTLIRLHASPQFVDRIATVDQQMGVCPFRQGDCAHMHLPSANRDVAVFEPRSTCLESGSFASARHLGFGIGLHKCPGATFAQTFIGIALPRLLARYPSLCLTTAQPEWVSTTFTRAPRALPCQITAKG